MLSLYEAKVASLRLLVEFWVATSRRITRRWLVNAGSLCVVVGGDF